MMTPDDSLSANKRGADPLVATDGLLQGYAAAADSDDEMWDAGAGCVRPGWQPYITAIGALGPETLERRHRDIKRLLRENGVTYNVHGDPDGLHRPWELDPIPMIIASDDWDRLETGLSQRAQLMDLIFADLYGARTLLKEGLLPPELVYGHPGFLRSCDGIRHPGCRQITFLAVDLARGPDRQFLVVGDRVQAPSGAGYALENRTVMARVFPDLIRDCRVRRLAQFFRSLRSALTEIAPQPKPNPGIGVLTPGPANETYFEQAYLAAYLGFTLVQGDDLMVRNGIVWLKALDGLKPLDVLLRRVDDIFCDPLELRSDSRLGVAGLLEAMRRFNVTVVNPLGSSLLESPGLTEFLPVMARHFLGEDLQLTAPATWWCGRPEGLSYVLEHLSDLLIQSTDGRLQIVPGEDRGALEELRVRIETHPHLYTGRQKLLFSTAPALVEGRLQPRREFFRTFLAACNGSYCAMPGGLALSASQSGPLQGAGQRVSISKDTWVLALEAQKHVSLWVQSERIEENLKSSSALPSRAAENLFWVGRYAERAEGVIRLLRTVLRSYTQTDHRQDSTDAECLQQLLRALAGLTGMTSTTAPGSSDWGQVPPEEELRAVLGDLQRPGSLATTLQHMIQAAYAVRHLWSTDSWRVINRIEEHWKKNQRITPANLSGVANDLDQLIMAMMAFAGLNSESMTREQGWLLLDIGRRLERSTVFCNVLRMSLVSRHPAAVDHLLLEAVLSTTENIITYRRRFRSRLHLQTVLDQLLLDDANPRSVIYQINRLQKHIAILPRERGTHRLSTEERLVLEAATLLRLCDPNRLTEAPPEAPIYPHLDRFLLQLNELLARTSDALNLVYFSHIPVSRQMPAGRTGADK
jgi:uncharacterized circularly permuted ATP-grasp superfamily protein/uncharacterized alpha-E superfamily protein